ncbi:MAG TPA: hypothetical protein DHW45_07885, partial [Candidatus Latescibacteria bacterium]|nr:hypothetical protein [Candidatus Latescibacterota bacterium]
GDPDLYVANFGPNVFFENLGNGTFQETGSILGIADSSSGIQPVFADFDNDSDPDLFVANSGPNRLWWNNGDGTFKDATKAFVPRDAGASTGAAVGDFDNDGFLDLYVPYFGTNRLYQNQGGTGFADVGRALGVADEGNGRGAVWGDFDNDGSIDLFITNRDSENKIFRNIGGDAQFQEVGKAFGVNANADSRGIAMADFDGDGGLDVFVAIQNRPDQLFWNQEAEGNWLTVVPRGTVSSTDAIGTRIEIVYGRNNKSVREIAGGTSFLSQDALSASFGVGETATIDTLSIRWPSGIFQRFSRADIGINRVLNILEIEPLPPVDVQVVTTSDVLIANGTAETEIAVRLLNQEREISLVSGRSITYSLDVGGGTLIPAGPTITDGFSSARFRAGSFAGTMPLTIIVAGLPTQRLLLKLLPPLLPSDTFIERIAGSGRRGFGGDGGPATQADLNTPRAVAVDSAENVYIADSANNRIRVVSPTDSSIVTVAGSGAAGSGTIFDGNALDADIADPRGLAITGDGALLISESGGQRVRSVNLTTGITRAFAGSGFAGFSGDGGPATDANLTTPRGITVDNLGRVSIADLFNNAIRRVEDGVITTVAGDPLDFFPLGDGIPATESRVQGPNGVAVDNDGNTYIAEVFGHRIRKVDSSGIITTYAGDGTAGSAGDGGPAQFARLNAPQDLVYDPAGRLYVSDSGNHIIRSIDLATGVIQKIAGSGFSGSTGNQGPSLDFSLDQPGGIALAMDGSLIISDALNDRVLRLTVQFQDDRPAADPTPIDPSGSDGTADFNGDGNVDFQDFLPFAEAFGSNNQAFDLDGDGQVGFSDFLTFANAFGRTVASNPALLGRTVWLKR